ncbi:globin [Haloferula sargassicola]|uniref:Group 2 truncated hemoglobin GlbO n=1 Tax=Haloferula sargassicola TaxID=490096 RepID=A0ABP9UNQ6_9BACT
METLEQTVARELGPEGITAMVAAFYRKVPDDDLLGPMYPAEEMAAAEERLRDFLKFRLLGDPVYQFKRGHPRLRMRHAPFAIGEKERDRWLELMEGAMEESGVSAAGQRVLLPFFADVAEFLRNR